jgi:hypothetical protein
MGNTVAPRPQAGEGGLHRCLLLELGAIGNAAPMKTDVVFRTHQEVGFRSLNAVAALTHLRLVALLWGAPLKAAPNEAATLVHKKPSHQPVTVRTADPVAGMPPHRLDDSQESKSNSLALLIGPESLTASRRPNRLHGQKNGLGDDLCCPMRHASISVSRSIDETADEPKLMKNRDPSDLPAFDPHQETADDD